ncbi:MAG: hypothetical protein DSZ24_06745 [Thermodesulfatator sp.]|nr:MAG: hypothetical protein DSZ24_06745 [Thermodesulfatator sp.]
MERKRVVFKSEALEEALKELTERYGPQAVNEAVAEVFTRWVRATGKCVLTGRRLCHEAVCGYCHRCPARPLERRA